MAQQKFQRFRTCVCLSILATVVGQTQQASSQDSAQDGETIRGTYAAGLIVRIADQEGRFVEQIDDTLGGWLDSNTKWSATKADTSWKIKWNGFLLAKPEGRFRFHGYARGTVRITVDGTQCFYSDTDTPSWVESEPVELEYGWRTLQVDYQPKGQQPLLKIAWSGPGFERELIPSRALFYNPSRSIGTPEQRGGKLVRDMGCKACHRLDRVPDLDPAPSLANLSTHMSRHWLIDWLTKPNSHSGMLPNFEFTPKQVNAIADHLLADPPDVKAKAPEPGNTQLGQKLFRTIGCLACHRADDVGPVSSRRDLSRVADKRSAGFLSTYLRNPQYLNSDHRMPVFDLSEEEQRDLVSYLLTLRSDGSKPSFSATSPSVAGKALVNVVRCGSCHQLPGDPIVVEKIPLPRQVETDRGCLADLNSSGSRPSYELSDADRDLVQAFLASKPGGLSRIAPAEPLQRFGCVACHPREAEAGIGPVALQVAAVDPSLAPQVPALIPPSLNQIGDKLNEKTLSQVIVGNGSDRRPWLLVRMPRFRFEPNEAKSLVRNLIAADRLPVESRKVAGENLNASQLAHGGTRLVTSAGFGCTSCHAIGESQPPNGPLNARGPDLASVGERIRRSWFDRWLRNPTRIVPRVEMPAITHPVIGVFEQQLDQQVNAVWHVLNQSDFRPPESDALRVVRRTGNSDQRSIVLTDVLYSRGELFVKPFLVALPNRHNVLFDFKTGRLAEWTIGDAARQRTKGKTWFWDLAGTRMLLDNSPDSDVAILAAGKRYFAETQGQFVTQADRWSHDDGGVEFQTRLEFAGPSPTRLWLTQRIQPSSNSPATAWQRKLSFDGDVARSDLSVRVIPDGQLDQMNLSSDARVAELPDGRRVRILSDGNAKFHADGFVVMGAAAGSAEILLEYESSIRSDQFPEIVAKDTSQSPAKIRVVPGFEAYRLPIGNSMMPTGLSWRPDGNLYVTSLKGRVWRIFDTDGDGFEDATNPFSDELAAPYGLWAQAEYVDVINKYGLLRLFDEDNDQRADRVVTLASGWGHTADYHDWAVGLSRDQQGRYLMALPCQQDDRNSAAGRYRGQVLRLTPRQIDNDMPMSYHIESISAGHRFPMGIALSEEQKLFVTDNQGNYNPYNELNYVTPRAHFGFVNRLDSLADRPAVTAPAIKIPHPWTRSVNGICFLETPRQLTAARFGPFEGHLIGCEYDTRRLIRFSLQTIGDTVQGAAYPFSLAEETDGEGLMGPIVCAISPRAEIYIGEIRDSGWGGGQNVGALVRLSPDLQHLPNGIAEVSAISNGFRLTFVCPVDPQRAVNPKNYAVESVTRTATPAYGGADHDRRQETIRELRMVDEKTVEIFFEQLRTGFVYEFRLRNLSKDQQMFYPAEAYYTLNQIPRE
ncbi:MAG: c-type cytochrome [Pirellulaceae bacterium]|nr:c-type cytochrome [Pirellulaceae bacterium]